MRLPTTARITVRPSREPAKRTSRRRKRGAGGGVQITARDREIFVALAKHRLLTAEQVRGLVFGTVQARRVRRRLKTLLDARLLQRVGVVAQPTRGVPPYVYGLSPASAEIASAELGQPVGVPSSANNSLRFVAHHVGVCDFLVALTQAVRATEWRIGEWRHEWELKVGAAPGAGRGERVHVTDPATNQELALTILPDGYFTLVRDDQTLHFFFEYDRSTHGLRRWRERAFAFSAYARQGGFQRRFGARGGESFRLLIVCQPDYRRRSRRDNILRTIEQAVGSSELFLASTVDELGLRTGDAEDLNQATSLLRQKVWSIPGSTEKLALLPSEPNLSGRRSNRPVVRVDVSRPEVAR